MVKLVKAETFNVGDVFPAREAWGVIVKIVPYPQHKGSLFAPGQARVATFANGYSMTLTGIYPVKVA